MSLTIHQGHWIDRLKEMADESVQMCVTSPPYWGLRSYLKPNDPMKAFELGCEQTPEEYVAKIVEGFREVKRVLKGDGVLWINLGSSYASSGGERKYGPYDGEVGRGPGTKRYKPFVYDKPPNQSRSGAPACGIYDKPPQDCSGSGRACPYCGDELQDGSKIRRAYNAGIAQPNALTGQQPLRKARGIERLDCASTSPPPSPPSVQDSTTPSLSENETVFCDLGATASEPQRETRSSLTGAHQSGDTKACTGGIAQKVETLALSSLGTGLFCKACGYCSIAHPVFKPKDLINIPAMVAESLRADGWYLRCDIIWSKPNPMPESVTDRPTKAHEYIFLMSKSPRYYYDHNAIKEPPSPALIKQIEDGYNGTATKDYLGSNIQDASATKSRIINGHRERIDKQRGHSRRHQGFNDRWDKMSFEEQRMCGSNKRSVWTVTPACFKEAHFATFPAELIKPCILAGSKPGDTVLDPFGGSGTSGQVALELGRNAILIELNSEYLPIIAGRCNVTQGLAL